MVGYSYCLTREVVATDKDEDMSETETMEAEVAPEVEGGQDGEKEAKVTRQVLLDGLKAAGYEGPTSYGKGRLREILDDVLAGRPVVTARRGRPARAKEAGNGDVDPEVAPPA